MCVPTSEHCELPWKGPDYALVWCRITPPDCFIEHSGFSILSILSILPILSYLILSYLILSSLIISYPIYLSIDPSIRPCLSVCLSLSLSLYIYICTIIYTQTPAFNWKIIFPASKLVYKAKISGSMSPKSGRGRRVMNMGWVKGMGQ